MILYPAIIAFPFFTFSLINIGQSPNNLNAAHEQKSD